MNQIEKYAQWQNTLQQHEYKYSPELYTKFKGIFKNNIIPTAWLPGTNELENSNLAFCLKELGFDNYHQFFSWASLNRDKFWDYSIKKLKIHFKQPYDTILDISPGYDNPIWCKNAVLNIVDSCFLAKPDKTALIIGSESHSDVIRLTYEELFIKVNQFANGLLEKGFQTEDRIILYLPFCEEAIIAFLGTIKAGMVNVLVADSFTSEELNKRTKISQAKTIITIDEYQYNGKTIQVYEKIKETINTSCIVVKRTSNSISEKDTDYLEIIKKGKNSFTSVKTKPLDFTSILFSSGTTGIPKAIPWTHLTPIKAASDAYYHQNIKENDIVTWTTGMGWMMAPWLIYAALINKATLAIYNGSPITENFGQFIENEKISILGTIPSVVRGWKKNSFHEKFNWQVKVFSSTGEPSSSIEYFYLMGLGNYKAPIIEYCGGTEIGGAYITGTVLQPASPGYFTSPALGLDISLLNSNKSISKAGETGEVYIIPPSLGLSQTLLNKDHFKEYYDGNPRNPQGILLRKHGDALERIVEGGLTYYKSIGRTDDTMNLGGIKISSIELEELVNKHPRVIESAAVAVQDKNGGPEKLIIFVVLHQKTKMEDLKAEIQDLINKHLNPLFRVNMVKDIKEMPRTASNKIMRKELRKEIK